MLLDIRHVLFKMVLFEKMDLKDNKLYPTIYGPYEMALMKDAPKEIETILIEGVDYAGPVGEPPLGPIGAAIGNAVRRLRGKRLTDLPMKFAFHSRYKFTAHNPQFLRRSQH